MLQRLSSFDRDILVTILQRLSPSGRNILVTKMYVQITKTKRKLFNTKHNIINRHPVILKYLDSPFISQYNTLTLQCRGKKMMIHDCTLLREKCPNMKFFLVRIWTLFTQWQFYKIIESNSEHSFWPWIISYFHYLLLFHRSRRKKNKLHSHRY